MKKKVEQKLVKVTKRKKTLADVGKDLHAAAAKAGGTLSIKKGLGETKDRDDKSAPVQQTLPAEGMVELLDKELDELAGKVTLAEEKAKSATTHVKERKDVLILKMKAKGRTTYVNRGLGIEINLEQTDKVRVKQYDNNDDDDRYT